MIEKGNILQTVHWVVTFAIGAGFLSYVNAVENKQVQIDTRQQVIIDNQKEIKQEIKEDRKERKEAYEKLLEEIRKAQ